MLSSRTARCLYHTLINFELGISPDFAFHVEYKNFYYSVPFILYRKKVTIRATDTMVEILDAGNNRVALHQRKRTGNRYVTNEAHMPERHRKQREADRRDGASYRQWAMSIGKNTWTAIDMLLKSQHVEQVSYRSCMGILQMEKKHGRSALEDACRNAVVAGDVRYATIKRFIENPPRSPGARIVPLPRHENLRDPSEFK